MQERKRRSSARALIPSLVKGTSASELSSAATRPNDQFLTGLYATILMYQMAKQKFQEISLNYFLLYCYII